MLCPPMPVFELCLEMLSAINAGSIFPLTNMFFTFLSLIVFLKMIPPFCYPALKTIYLFCIVIFLKQVFSSGRTPNAVLTDQYDVFFRTICFQEISEVRY